MFQAGVFAHSPLADVTNTPAAAAPISASPMGSRRMLEGPEIKFTWRMCTPARGLAMRTARCVVVCAASLHLLMLPLLSDTRAHRHAWRHRWPQQCQSPSQHQSRPSQLCKMRSGREVPSRRPSLLQQRGAVGCRCQQPRWVSLCRICWCSCADVTNHVINTLLNTRSTELHACCWLQ